MANKPKGVLEYQNLIKGINKLMFLVGLNINDLDYNFNNKFLKIQCLQFFVYALVNIYSLFGTYGDFVQFVFSLVSFGLFYQGITTLQVFLKYKDEICDAVDDFYELYKRNSDREDGRKILDHYVAYSLKAFVALRFIYFGAGVLAMVAPLTICYITWSKVLPFGIYLPFIDKNTTLGFILNYLYVLHLDSSYAPGMCGGEMFYFNFMIISCGRVTIIISLLQDLDKHLDAFDLENGRNKNNPDVAQLLQRICLEHQKHLKFIGTVTSIYKFHSFCMMSTFCLIIILSLLVLVDQAWILGIVAVILATSQMLMHCFMGTIYEVKCEELTNKLYDIKWHFLTTSQQKNLKMVLRMAQEPKLPSMGGFLPLSLSTFLQVFKQIYSIFMMLLRFTD